MSVDLVILIDSRLYFRSNILTSTVIHRRVFALPFKPENISSIELKWSRKDPFNDLISGEINVAGVEIENLSTNKYTMEYEYSVFLNLQFE